MKNRVLVTGSEGFVGKILCRYLNDKGYQVFGGDVQVADGAQDRRACDIADAESVAGLLD